MKNIFLSLIIGLITTTVFSQEKTEKAIFDSIINEANLLYNYEKIAWNASDLAYSNKKIKNKIGSYIVYHSNDTIFAVFANKEYKNQIAKYSYLKDNLTEPIQENLEKKPLSEKVLNLFTIKNTILNSINSNFKEYGFSFHEGFNPNPVLIPDTNGFKLYIIIGTPNSNVIPFGNDYLFKTDKKGKITEWKKFHKTLIATQTTSPDNEKIISAIHSHLKTTPYITATDICTFRLYGYDLYELEEFKVLSTKLNKIFTYNAKHNTITSSSY